MVPQCCAGNTVGGCQAGGLGHLLLFMRKYNAESPKQGRKRFNSIVKTINFSYLPFLFIYGINGFKFKPL